MTSVVFIVHALDVGGAETMLVNIVNRLNKRKFRCTVISLSSNNPLQTSIRKGIAEVKVFKRRWRYDLSPSGQIRVLLRQISVDCLVCFDFYTFFFARLALRGWHGLPPKVFISVHTTIPRTLKERLQTWVYARLLRDKDRVLTACCSQADYLSRTYGISRRQFVSVYNGVDTTFFAFDQVKEGRDAIVRRLGIPRDANVILHVSNFTPTKRHEDMLTALRILMDRNPELNPFYISVGGGDPERQKQIQYLATRIGVMDRILFAGIQNDVRPFYQIAACACLASTSETFSMAALEAMSMGIPVIMTEVGGAREMVIDGFNGLLIPPRQPDLLASAMASVIAQEKRFDSMAIRQHVIDHFSIQKCIRNYEQLIGKKE